MTEDIVTRLREQAKDWQADGYQLDEAADEIERLRNVLVSFPCTCWINKPKCKRCDVLGVNHD